jgi:hypothetical protein
MQPGIRPNQPKKILNQKILKKTFIWLRSKWSWDAGTLGQFALKRKVGRTGMIACAGRI